jgi:hypothetical protein
MKILKAEYTEAYKINVIFDNGESTIINLKSFLFNTMDPIISDFRKLERFQDFIVFDDGLVWGAYEFGIPLERIINSDVFQSENIKQDK